MLRAMVLGLVMGMLASVCLADTPANCMYEDIRGTWTFYEDARDDGNTINCVNIMGAVVYTNTFTLDFPNTVKDDLGNEGTWTMVWNQGFEVNINERSYFAFSYYEGDLTEATSYCDQTFIGWSHDTTIRNWSCFNATKTTSVKPRKTKKLTIPKDKMNQKYKNDHNLISDINGSQSSWRAKAYPEHEQFTVYEMFLRGGGPRSVLPNPPPVAMASEELKQRVKFLPENLDWRNVDGQNFVTDVRDQAACGSCYTFASVGQIESRVRIATKNARQDIFSPQDVVSCSELSQGCDGGFNYLIAGRYAQDQGVVAEECNPYDGTDSPCDTDPSCLRTYVRDYTYVGGYYGACNEELMLEALATNGPMAVAYEVYDDFYNYHGGIYHHTGLKNEFNPFEMVNHAVLLVGYGVEPTTGEKFWTLKNSWGSSWGEDGYFRIRRGTNECSMESMAVDIEVIP